MVAWSYEWCHQSESWIIMKFRFGICSQVLPPPLLCWQDLKQTQGHWQLKVIKNPHHTTEAFALGTFVINLRLADLKMCRCSSESKHKGTWLDRLINIDSQLFDLRDLGVFLSLFTFVFESPGERAQRPEHKVIATPADSSVCWKPDCDVKGWWFKGVKEKKTHKAVSPTDKQVVHGNGCALPWSQNVILVNKRVCDQWIWYLGVVLFFCTQLATAQFGQGKVQKQPSHRSYRQPYVTCCAWRVYITILCVNFLAALWMCFILNYSSPLHSKIVASVSELVWFINNGVSVWAAA